MDAIVFENVGKLYRRRQHRSFRDWFVALGPKELRPNAPDRFWALRDVSFTIRPGESVGLIGHNGAGKSTALKLIGRLSTPTRGRVRVNGRVAALLELGAGFHPELSGRDNVFLSGALFGMTRREMAARYDAIVAFAELEDFMEMPVKHYSSGMFARLAFSVSAQIDPEILLVDEALAVGDYNFQQKCLTRIDELKAQGVTIILVSHDREMIRTHCRRVLWFDHGQLIGEGDGEAQLARYLDSTVGRSLDPSLSLSSELEEGRRWGSREIEITGVRVTDATGGTPSVFRTGSSISIHIAYRAGREVKDPVFGLAIHRRDGVHLTGPNTRVDRVPIDSVFGEGEVIYTVPQLALLDGGYQISVAAHHADGIQMYDYHDRLYDLRVDNRKGVVHEHHGMLSLLGSWQIRDRSS